MLSVSGLNRVCGLAVGACGLAVIPSRITEEALKSIAHLTHKAISCFFKETSQVPLEFIDNLCSDYAKNIQNVSLVAAGAFLFSYSNALLKQS